MKKLIILFFLASCVSPNSNIDTNNTKLNFNDDLTFDEFNQLLIQYAKTSPYPNINKFNFDDDLTFNEFEKMLIQYAETNPYPNIDE